MKKRSSFFIRIGIVFFLTVLINVLVPVASANETDSGTVTITGSVLPQPTSIITSVNSSASSSEVPQDTEIIYTAKYSSQNTSSIPLHIKVSWEKGKVEGATEPNVEVVTYVVGSATKGYGEAQPIVDSKNRSITWFISNLPGNTSNQEVQFTLRTTSSYTGNKKVTFPVTVSVDSPVGVPDKTIMSTYVYKEPEPTSPNPSPTATSSLATATTLQQSSPISFQAVGIQSIGAASARIVATTTQPTGLILRYGATPTSLNRAIIQTLPSLDSELPLEHRFTLTELQPNTQYYFQVRVPDQETQSDIFTFMTSSQGTDESLLNPEGLVVTQSRTVIFSGKTPGSTGEATQPIVVAKDTVFDLTLTVPKAKVVRSVEVLVRNQGILGATTENPNGEIDELQSTTSIMTQVADDLYVGKLRSPVATGSYEVVSRIEDIYGNISDQKIGILEVVSPFTITDKSSGEPLEYAQVTLFLYNRETKLYEQLSNITNSIKNPTFTDKKGVVNVSLFPGKYKAKISLAGYKDTTIEFEVGTENAAHLPHVSLELEKNIFLGKIAHFLGLLITEFSVQFTHIQIFARSQVVFYFILVISFILFLVSSICSFVLFRSYASIDHVRAGFEKTAHKQKMVYVIGVVGIEVLRFCTEFFLALCLLFGLLFFSLLGPEKGGLVLVITSLIIGIWCVDMIFLRRHHDHVTSTKQN